MPGKRQYIVRTVADGRTHSVTGLTASGAAKAFMRERDLPVGTKIQVKPRGERAPWENYDVIARGS